MNDQLNAARVEHRRANPVFVHEGKGIDAARLVRLAKSDFAYARRRSIYSAFKAA